MVTYSEDIYPSWFTVATGNVWVHIRPFIKPKLMPVLICAWQHKDQPYLTMCHQSLQ